jgi:rod shape determining protein RodA
VTAASAISRPGERDRTSRRFAEIDWNLAIMLCLIAGAGALMLFSIANSSWEPWAAKHLIRYGLCFAFMIALAMVDLRLWFALSYPVYGLALALLVCVELFGYTAMGATRWLDLGFTRIQPSEIMKIGIVMALARFYHGLTAKEARWSWKLLVPVVLIAVPVLLVAHQPDLGTSLLILFTGVAIMILAGLSWKAIVAGVAAAAVTAPMMFFFVLHDYQRTAC